MSPILEFSLNLPAAATANLVMGQLLIKERPELAGIKLEATSGCIGYQFERAWMLKGRGPLPPSSAIAPKRWTVSTQRLWMPDTRGVEGSFYAIAPFSVQLGKIGRGDFGCHFDANVPGSAGCCVIPNQAHWDLFRRAMEEFRIAGFQQIPLLVHYR